MKAAAATTAMREKADALLTERARLGTAMRRIHTLAGLNGLKACFESELERLKADNDNGVWIG